MNTKYLDAMMESMPRRGFPACDLAVTHHGKTVYRRMVGVANQATGQRVDENTLWLIYSASKISTCTAAMQLVEQGKLGLDDPVSKYIPEYADLTVETPNGIEKAANIMKILHLFTMTGGLDYDNQAPMLKAAQDAGLPTLDVVRAISRKPLRFEPGTHYLYSFCHDVLGGVIEVISGMKLSEYFEKNIFSPLGMTNTGFHPTPEQEAHIADLYQFQPFNGVAEKVPRTVRVYPNEHYESGGGGLISSAGDYSKLMTALALGGVSPEGRRILKKETVAMMGENRLSDACRADLFDRMYGYGFGLCGRAHMNPAYSLSHSAVGEFGWDGAAAAYALADPAQEIAIYFASHVLGCNYAYRLLHPMLRNAVYEAIGG